MLDLRTYKLVPGGRFGRETFDRFLREGALPMLGVETYHTVVIPQTRAIAQAVASDAGRA